MTESEQLRKRFAEQENISFDEIPINGVHLKYIEFLESQITGKSLPTNEEIQAHIENNCRNEHGEPMMREQEFYEGAKWMRDNHLNQKPCVNTDSSTL